MPRVVRLALVDCLVARARWINEKRLYVEVWWGRPLGAYLVVDVEAERIVVRERVRDGNLPFQQHRQRPDPSAAR